MPKLSKEKVKQKVLEGLIGAMDQAIPDEALPKKGEALVIDMSIGKAIPEKDADDYGQGGGGQELDPRLRKKIREAMKRK